MARLPLSALVHRRRLVHDLVVNALHPIIRHLFDHTHKGYTPRGTFCPFCRVRAQKCVHDMHTFADITHLSPPACLAKGINERMSAITALVSEIAHRDSADARSGQTTATTPRRVRHEAATNAGEGIEADAICARVKTGARTRFLAHTHSSAFSFSPTALEHSAIYDQSERRKKA